MDPRIREACRTLFRRLPWGPLSLPLAAVAGWLTCCGFAPARQWPAALCGLALLCWLTELRPGWRRAAALGWLWGLACFAPGLSWVLPALATHGGLGPWLAGIGLFVFAAALALFPALACALASLPALPAGLRGGLALPLCWILLELIRCHVFGFGWLSVGYAFGNSVFASWAPLGGTAAVGLAALLAAGLLAACLTPGCAPRAKVITALVAGLAVLGADGLQRFSWHEPAGRLEVRLVQPDLPVLTRIDARSWEERRARTLALSARASLGRPLELIVWPEGALPTSLQRLPADDLRSLSRLAEDTGATLLFNAFDEPRPGDFYNSLWRVDPGATPAPVYAKRHLVPFGEYEPFGLGWFVRLLGVPLSDQRRGVLPEAPPRLAGHPFAAALCYENSFGAELRQWWELTPPPDLIVVSANLGWFGPAATEQFSDMSALRARELARPLLQVINNAGSAAFDASGRVERSAGSGAQDLDLSLPLVDGADTPYARWADRPLTVLLLCLLAFLAWWGRPRRAQGASSRSLSSSAAPTTRSMS